MRRLIFLILLLFSSHCYAQCIDCRSLKDALIKPGEVKTLKMNGLMSDIALDSLPSSIGLLTNIRILYLSDHHFKTVPHEIGNLQNLTELSFAGCKLESLPDEIFTLKNLKEIILSDNAFSDTYKTALKTRFSTSLPNTKIFLD